MWDHVFSTQNPNIPGTSATINPPLAHQLKVYIYIDNSNLLVQGRRTYAFRHNMSADEDPTWRCNYIGLKAILTAKSRLSADGQIDEPNVKVNLYGSTIHPAETVYSGIKSDSFNVNLSQRSSWTGGEKEVDVKVITDLMEHASEAYFNHVKAEFILVTGDRDMYYPVEKVATKYNLPVHIWSWDNALASVYTEAHHPLIHVYSLDEYLEQIGFCEPNFRLDKNVINPRSIVILDPLPKADEIEEFFSDWKFPTRRYEFEEKRADASSSDLAVVPALSRHIKDDALDDAFQAAKTHLESHGLSVMTYFEYSQHYLHSSEAELIASNRFHALLEEECQGRDAIKGSCPEKDDSEHDFVTVDRYARQKKRRLQNDERKSRYPCIWGKYCKKGSNCKYGHTKAEEEMFKVYGPLPVRKFKFCQNENCIRGTGCAYAHDEAELLCPTCGETGAGHEMDDCPQSPRNKYRRY